MSRQLCFLCLVYLLSTCARAQGDGRWTEKLVDFGIDSMHYLVNYPEGYTATDTVRWPLVLFLHGGGEGGDDLETVKRVALPYEIEQGATYPFVTVAPQNKLTRGFWDIRGLDYLLDQVLEQENVDPDRVYLTGFSRGALGAWMLAMQTPERFAALVPLAGAVPRAYHVWIPQDLPIWIFHGTDDTYVPLSESLDFYEILLGKGMEPKPKLTVYEGMGHNPHVRAYRDAEMWAWLLGQRR